MVELLNSWKCFKQNLVCDKNHRQSIHYDKKYVLQIMYIECQAELKRVCTRHKILTAHAVPGPACSTASLHNTPIIRQE